MTDTGGPKMRKWYGQESNKVPREGGGDEEQPNEVCDPVNDPATQVTT